MTERKRMSWATLLGAVPKSDPPNLPANDENVIHLRRMSLDDLEQRGRDLQNRVVDAGIAVDRSMIDYNTRRADLYEWRREMTERLKDLGIRAEFPIDFPEADLKGDGDE